MDDAPKPSERTLRHKSCAFCRRALKTIAYYDHDVNLDPLIREIHDETCQGGRLHGGLLCGYIHVCENCGWWSIHCIEDIGGDIFGACGSLKELDLTDMSTPVNEVKAYLKVRYDMRFTLNPRLFEETVASVFRCLGYGVRVTAYQGDGGIDVILDGPDESLIGVQVKRYRSNIAVEQIRALAGSLILGDMTRGVFVTTSDFQSGCSTTAEKYSSRGLPIELLNAERFYEALRIERSDVFLSSDELVDALGRVPKAVHVGYDLEIVD